MKKFLTLLLIIFLSCMIAGIYGILHDQLTYTISPEYYTEFKFDQFGIMVTEGHERSSAALVGFLATWWMGLIIGTLLALVGLIHKTSKAMLVVTMRALLITLAIAAITGLMGLVYGKLFLVGQPIENFEGWYIPYTIKDIDSFIMVGSMHNFSYLGGVIGLVAGIAYSVRMNKRKDRAILLSKHNG